MPRAREVFPGQEMHSASQQLGEGSVMGWHQASQNQSYRVTERLSDRGWVPVSLPEIAPKS